jgi:hypothetical protein
MSADNGDGKPRLLRYTQWLHPEQWPPPDERGWSLLAHTLTLLSFAQSNLARQTGAEPVGPWEWGWVPPGGPIPEPHATDLAADPHPTGYALLYGECPAVRRTPEGVTPKLWTPGAN